MSEDKPKDVVIGPPKKKVCARCGRLVFDFSTVAESNVEVFRGCEVCFEAELDKTVLARVFLRFIQNKDEEISKLKTQIYDLRDELQGAMGGPVGAGSDGDGEATE
jgi:hypothetical protein